MCTHTSLQLLPVLCRVELKELKIRPNTDVHDYQVRLRSAAKFISKVSMAYLRTSNVQLVLSSLSDSVPR